MFLTDCVISKQKDNRSFKFLTKGDKTTFLIAQTWSFVNNMKTKRRFSAQGRG